MLQELAEQLSISFDNKVKHQPQGHARARAEDYSHLGSPATGSRTQEPLRFPGIWRYAFPLNLRYVGEWMVPRCYGIDGSEKVLLITNNSLVFIRF